MKEQKSNPMARIWEIAKPEHGRLLLSVVLAVLGVVSGIVPFVSAAKIISGMISGNREWSYYLVFVAAAFAGFALKSLFYAMGLSVSHRATFSLLGEIRKQIFAKLPRMPLGTIIDTSSGKLKQIIVDGGGADGTPHSTYDPGTYIQYRRCHSCLDLYDDR